STGQNADAPVPFLFAYDVSTHSLTAQLREFTSDPTNAGAGDVAPIVSGFSFVNNTGTDELVAFVTGKKVDVNGADQGIATQAGIIPLLLNTLNFDRDRVTPVTLPGTPITMAHGLEIVPGTDSEVYMVEGTGSQARLLRVTIATGFAQNFGGL